MADFNPQLPKEQDRVFFNFSKPIPQPEFRTGSPAPLAVQKDTSFFDTFGDIIQTAAKGGVNLAEDAIRQETHEKVEPIVKNEIENLNQIRSQVTGEPSLLPKSQEVPQGVRQGLQNISMMHASRQNGVMTESQYLMHLYDTASELRTKYPSFRNVIDDEVHAVTGRSMANTVIAQLKADIDSYTKQGKDFNDKVLTKAMQHLDIDGMPVMVEALRNNKISPYDMMKFINSATSRKRENEDAILELNRGDKEREGLKNKATVIGSSLANQVVTDHMSSLMSASGINSDPEAAVAGLNQTKQDPIKTRQDMEAANLAMEAKIRAKLHAPLTDPATNQVMIDRRTNQPMTVANLIGDPAKEQEVIDKAMAIPKRFSAYLTDEKYGPAVIAGLTVKRMGDERHLALYRDKDMGEILQDIEVWRKTAGDAAMATLLPEVLPQFAKSYGAYVVSRMAKAGAGTLDPDGSDPSLKKDYETMAKAGVKGDDGAPAYSALLKNVERLARPDVKDDEKRNIAKYVYGPEGRGLIARIEKDSIDPKTGKPTQGEYSVYRRLSSPEMLGAAHRLGGDTWKYARDFVLSTYSSELLKPMIINLNRAAQRDTGLQYTYNDQTHHWGVNGYGIKDLQDKDINSLPVSGDVKGNIRATVQPITRLNTANDGMTNVYKLEGKDPNQGLMDTYIHLGIDPAVGKLQGVPQQLFQAAKTALEQQQKEGEELRSKYRNKK